jgi:hypothetical protein
MFGCGNENALIVVGAGAFDRPARPRSACRRRLVILGLRLTLRRRRRSYAGSWDVALQEEKEYGALGPTQNAGNVEIGGDEDIHGTKLGMADCLARESDVVWYEVGCNFEISAEVVEVGGRKLLLEVV